MPFSEEHLLGEIHRLVMEKQYRLAKQKLSEMEPIDIAEGLENLPSADLVFYFRLLPKDLATEVFELLDFDEQERFLSHASDAEVSEIIEQMSDDDRTELLDELPAKTVERLLLQLSPDERKLANTLLGYPPSSAGRIMTPEYIDLQSHSTAKDALERIRRTARSKETIYSCFVTDEQRHLLGVVDLEELIMAEPNVEVDTLMDGDPVCVETTTDREDASRIISRYDLHTAPVVDSEHRLVGIITFDDVLDVVEDEGTEDLERLAGTEPVQEGYMDANLLTVAMKRFVWLVICILTETLTSSILKYYSPLLKGTVALSFFIPLLIGTGGNASTQSSTIMIRDMSQRKIRWRDMIAVSGREMVTGAVLGVSLAVLAFARAWMLGVGLGMSLTVSAALVVILILSNVSGALLPVAAVSIHVDPAIVSGPLITSIVDIFGLVVYFEMARHFLAL